LSSEELHLLAIESGFCTRKSKLLPEVFFDLMFYASSQSHNSSLESLVSYLYSTYGIDIKRQSLDERFKEKTVNFVKTVLKRLICEQLPDMLISEDFLKEYNHVRIKDSTTFKVPANLSEHYPGNGGGLAGITIQFEFDLKTGKFLDLTVTEASRNDQTDSNETIDNICKNDLILRDMGYFSIEVLKAIERKEAFYLFRLPARTTVYDENGMEIDFKKLQIVMSEKKIDKLDKNVFIGKEKYPCRLIIWLVPPCVYQERVRRKRKEEKKRGRQTKEETIVRLHFNLFVTNADDEKLPAEKIMPLYRFRWQVELMFKNWKSLFSIHKLQKMKEERYITMLYTRLILIVIDLQIINKVQSQISKHGGGILSYQKTLQTLKNNFLEILNILRNDLEIAIKQLEKIYLTLSKNHWREKRKYRENFIENIDIFICISEK